LQHGFLQPTVLSPDTAPLGISGELRVRGALLTLSVTRDQSYREKQGGALQQRAGVTGNTESHSISLASPFHPQERAKLCSRGTGFPTLQGVSCLRQHVGWESVDGQHGEHPSGPLPAWGAHFCHPLQPHLCSPHRCLGQGPAGCRGPPPSPTSARLSMRVGAQGGHRRRGKQLSGWLNSGKPLQVHKPQLS